MRVCYNLDRKSLFQQVFFEERNKKKPYIYDIQPPCLAKIYDTFYEPFTQM